MSLSILQHIKHSFAAKLNFWILFFLLLIEGTRFGLFHYYASHIIEKQTQEKLDEFSEKTSLKIVQLLRTIEKIPENLSWILPSYITHPDSIFSITRQVVENNFEIFGCAIAFEPFYFPSKGQYFAPYSYIKEDSVITTQINKKYDYYRKNWYRIAKEMNISRWSRPYHELSAQEMITTTYSVPLHNAQKQVIGIFSVDLSMDWLAVLIDSIKPYEDSYNIIVTKEKKFILHPGHPFITGQSPSDSGIFSALSDTTLLNIAPDILKGEKGNGDFYYNGLHFYVYYTPILGTDWVMASIFPYSHIYKGFHRFNLFLLFTTLFLAILIIIANTIIIRKITTPLKKFALSAHSIATGNFNTILPQITSKDEMRELQDAFHEMQEKLADYMDHLKQTTIAKEKIESELRIAHDIQMNMLPKTFPPFPERNEIDLYAVLYPARQVGGDFYDYFIRENYLYFAIGDVSGKGIPASLLMSSTVSLMRMFSDNYTSPAQIANLLNNSLANHNENGMFITLFAGKLDLDSGILKYCNAGHTLPLLTKPDKSVSFWEVEPALPLGLLKEFRYEEHCYQFNSGSGLLLYTDGVTDAENEKGEFYTKERLLNIAQTCHNLHPYSFTRRILKDIRKHIGGYTQSDDLSILTFIYGKEWNIKNS